MKARFKVKMTQKIMFDFLVNHTYKSSSGLFSIALGLFSLGLGIFRIQAKDNTMGIALAIFGVYILLFMPIRLYFNAAKQTKLNPSFKQPITYTVDEEGITSVLGKQEGKILWEQILKVRETKYSLLFYTGKRYCSIFPKQEMGKQQKIVVELAKKHLKAEQMKIKC